MYDLLSTLHMNKEAIMLKHIDIPYSDALGTVWSSRSVSHLRPHFYDV